VERTLLCYPDTIVKDDEWLRASLLYSDKISSIVPYRDGMKDERFPDYIRLLYNEGEYYPVLTKEMFYTFSDDRPEQYRKFEDTFIELINSTEFQPQIKNKIAFIERSSMDFGVYRGGPAIINALYDGGFVHSQYHFYEDTIVVDETVVLAYIAYLARFVSDTSSDFVVPTTNNKKYEALVFETLSPQKEAFNIILKNCLPIPSAEASLEKIIKFKRDRRDELLRLRVQLDELKTEINNSETKRELNEKLISFKERVELSLADIAKAGKSDSLNLIASTFNNLVDLKNPNLFASLISSGVIATVNPLLSAGVGAVAITTSLVTEFLENKGKNNNNEFGYLYSAVQKGLLES